MSANIHQVFIANPITTNISTDLMYFGRSPYGAGNDTAMTFANFALQFVSPIVSGAGIGSARGGDGTETAGGNYSFSYGNSSTSAGGLNSFSFGQACSAAGIFSFAFGSGQTVTSAGSYSMCFGGTSGSPSSVSGQFSLSFGSTNTNASSNSITFGNNCTTAASQSNCFSFGLGSSTGGSYSWAIGNNAKANNSGSWVIGDSNINPAQDTGLNQFCATFAGGYFLKGGNVSSNNFIGNYASITTAAATTTLTSASSYSQNFTGTTTQTVLLPVTATLSTGFSFYITNNSTGVVTVQSSGGNTIQAMAAGSTLIVKCVATTGTTSASWISTYIPVISGGAAVWTVGAGTDSGIGGDGTSTASGNYSLTYGSGSNTTTRDNSFTFGIANTNSVQRSVIFGSNNLNSGTTQGYNFTFGDSNTINSAYSIIFGSSCQLNFVTNGYSFVFGNSSIGNGDYSWAIGNGAQTNNNGSWVVGDSNIFPVQDTAANQFCLTFNGGYFLNGSSLTASTHLALNANKQVISVPTYTIGQYAQGGVIFWLNPTKTSGLVAAIVDQDGGSGVQWYNGSLTQYGIFGNGVYVGKDNTTAIIAAQGAGTYAATDCTSYSVTVGGVTYNDWYLPDQIELALMYMQQTNINTTSLANSGTALVATSYWSSNESTSINAFSQSMTSGGGQAATPKSTASRVRAIRAF